MHREAQTLIIGCLACLLCACSTQQTQLSGQLVPSATPALLYTLEDAVTIKASRASATVLKAGTTWTEVGSLEQGKVYRTKDQVVIVNSFNVHEGYIVVSDNQVVGYYLPVEKTFVATKPKGIRLTQKENQYEL